MTAPTRLVLNARAAFVTVVTPQAHPSDKKVPPTPYYSCNYLIPKGDPQIAAIEAAELQAIAEKHTNGNLEKAKPIYAAAKAIGKTAMHDGDLKPDYDGYPGNMYVSARTAADRGKPVIYGLGGKAAGPVDPTTVYSGCYVRGVVNIFGYGGRDGIQKGCSAGLGDIQFMAKGDAFGAGAPKASEDEFGSIDAPAENDPLAA